MTRGRPRLRSPGDLVDDHLELELDPDGHPTEFLEVVDLRPLGTAPEQATVTRLTNAAQRSRRLVVGCCEPDQVDCLQPLATSFATTLVEAGDLVGPAPYVAVDHISDAIDMLVDGCWSSPDAALVLAHLVHHAPGRDVWEGLVAESAAYSMLLAGAAFACWRAAQPRRTPTAGGDPIRAERVDDELLVVLNRPERRNAFDSRMRDALCEVLEVARLDPAVKLRMRGAGSSFCSGGDLDEFGVQTDPVTAHAIRLHRHVGWLLHEVRDRAVVSVHGACIGAGVELPAFAGRVVAARDAWFRLPELGMGLIPGAGGTVSVSRRVGSWRAFWLAATGARLDVDTALAWGLVDAVTDDASDH